MTRYATEAKIRVGMANHQQQQGCQGKSSCIGEARGKEQSITDLRIKKYIYLSIYISPMTHFLEEDLLLRLKE